MVMEVFLVLAILAFAIVGLITVGRWLLSSPAGDKPGDFGRPLRNMNDDAIGAGHLLNQLYREKRVTTQAYTRIWGLLENRFGTQCELPKRVELAEVELPAGPARPQAIPPAVSDQPEPSEPAEFVPATFAAAKPVRKAAAQMTVPVLTKVEMPVAEVAAPWDAPDPPPRAPKKTFNEFLAAFMQEKNIRWGELASGILIVGSAVGLVVSLRNELTRTIPYFPALLFLLITAGIHAAGSYTLKKWKLRTTSRGALLIGLLLVPLNFLAACILSGSEQLRRPLDDPLYWLAIIVGLGVFGAMIWWSSRLLLKRGHWPMVLGVMGAAVTTLVINRLDWIAGSSWQVLLMSMPLAVSMFLGSGLWSRTIRSGRRWSDRTLNRSHMLLGLAVFACITAVSLIFIRTPDRTFAITAIMPLVVFVSLITSWTGLIAHDGVSKNRLNQKGSDPLKTREGLTPFASGSSHRMISRALTILGIILAVLALLASTPNPMVLMICGAVVALVGAVIVQDRKLPELMPVVWAGLSIALVCGVHLGFHQSGIDSRIGLSGMRDLIFSGQSGLGLMGLGLAIGAFYGFVRPVVGAVTAGSAQRSNLIAAGVIGSAGCLFALVAGLMNRESYFDTMTASVLLGVASVVSLGLASTRNRPLYPHLAAVVLLAFLAFTFFWNPATSEMLVSVLNGVQANWLATFAVHGLIVVVAACVASVRMPDATDSISGLGMWAAVTSALAVASAIWLAPAQTAMATVMMVVVVASWVGITWSGRNVDSGNSWPTSLMIVAGLLLVVGLIDNATRLGIADWRQPEHWLIQSTVLAGWALVWTVGRQLAGKTVPWLFDFDLVRGEQIVQFALLTGLAGLLGVALYQANARQLVAGYESQAFLAAEHMGLCMVATGLLFVSLVVSFSLRQTLVAGIALATVWCMGWSVPSLMFDASFSAGSAIRWLLAISCVVTALIVASRSSWTKSGGLEGGDSEAGREGLVWNRMIDWFLTVSVGIVIVVSSATVARVMLSESQVAALGGPVAGSWFGRMPMEVSYGVPVALITAGFLLFAIFERRQWLATIGSGVYQYMVLFSILLLYLSPHPKLATSWFLNILQAVSLGMSVYGMAWFVFRVRIRGAWGSQKGSDPEKGRKGQTPFTNSDPGEGREGQTPFTNATVLAPGKSLTQIEIHTVINALLVTSLAVLVGWRIFASPAVSGSWVNSAGGVLGIIALLLVTGLCTLVARDRVLAGGRVKFVMWISGWIGMVLVAMLAANIDRYLNTPWFGLRTIGWGSAAVLAGLGGLAVYLQRRPGVGGPAAVSSGPVWISAVVSLLFAVRGGMFDQPNVWQYCMMAVAVVIVATAAGILARMLSTQYIGVAGLLAGAVMMRMVNPGGIFPADQPGFLNLVTILLCVLSGVWAVVHVWQRNRDVYSPGFGLLPNVVLLGSAIWMLAGGLLQWALDSDSFWFGSGSVLANVLGLVAVFATVVHAGIVLWMDRVVVRVAAGYLISVGIVLAGASVVVNRLDLEPIAENLWMMFGLAMVVLGWGVVWKSRGVWMRSLDGWSVPRTDAIERGLSVQLPVYGVILSMFVLSSSHWTVSFVELRPLRYLAAMTPFLLAIGFGCLAHGSGRRIYQLVSLAIVTLGFVLVGWADLPPIQSGAGAMEWLVRLVMILAGTMFVYGALVSRWTREGDTWLRSLREMTVFSCAIATVGLLWLVLVERGEFVAGSGCGVGVTEACGLAVVVLGMIVGLVTVAMRPRLDPFAMSETGRMAYVYAAQGVSVLLVFHLYLTMPWLFQSGIGQYWPYLLMAMAFGGVGVAGVLRKRDLMVLSQPLFNAAAVLPVLVSAGIWAVDSRADASMVLFAAGLAYLMISQTNGSMLAGVAAIVLGNLGLWVFYNRRPEFSFFDHPQLWLIPPAVSVLIAAHLSRARFNAGQLATIRYLCVAVIYVSSTSEIFISGIGTNLWPPIVLAVLALVGIFAGMALQVRAYLYLGSLFLLMAMITMVSLAHQQLGHVWPWWAFGIGSGMTILILFGLFEKHRNKMKSITDRLQRWDL